MNLFQKLFFLSRRRGVFVAVRKQALVKDSVVATFAALA